MLEATPSVRRHRFCHPLRHAAVWLHRPQLEEVMQWWKDGGGGVLALIGIAEIGKTAIVDRFLELLPNVLSPHPSLPKNIELSTPARLFVYSFDTAPNIDQFFLHLEDFIRGTFERRDQDNDFQQLLFALQDGGPCLLVLDGLDVMQNDTQPGANVGEPSDRRLRELLYRAADGYLPSVSILLTSRYSLPTLELRRSTYFRVVRVDEFDQETAVALLRENGVRDTKSHLLELANDCHLHPSLLNRAPAKPEPLVHQLVSRYQSRLLPLAPVTWNLLVYCCLTQHGINAETLIKLLGGERPPMSLSTAALQDHLDCLAAMNLIYMNPNCDRGFYKTPPALRAGVLARLTPDEEQNRRRRLFEALLPQNINIDQVRSAGKRLHWQQQVYNANTLLRIEDAILQAAMTGNLADAVDIYWKVLGGYARLAHRNCNNELGQRITKRLLALYDVHPNVTRDWRYCAVLCDLAGFNRQLGQLETACQLYKRGIQPARKCKDVRWEWIAKRNLTFLLILQGRLKRAVRHSENLLAEKPSRRQVDDEVADTSTVVHDNMGDTHFLLGNLKLAETHYRLALPKPNAKYYATFSAIGLAALKLAVGDLAEANHLVDSVRTQVEQRDSQLLRAYATLYKVQIAVARTALADARHHLAEFKAFAGQSSGLLLLVGYYYTTALLGLSELLGKRGSAIAPELESTTIAAISQGLRLAAESGYAMHFINLLLLRARLRLFQGDSQAALSDLQLAIDQGLPGDPEEGLPILRAASHPDFQYAWGLAEGLHLRGIAHLLHAAQVLGERSFVSARRNDLPSPVRMQIEEAEKCLKRALSVWKRLRDPRQGRSNNLLWNGEEYCFRAHETVNALDDLASGVLTRYRLVPAGEKRNADHIQQDQFDVFVSHNSRDKPLVAQLAATLQRRGLRVWLDTWETRPGTSWHDKLEKIIRSCRAAIICIGANGVGPWEDEEIKALVRRHINEKQRGVDLPLIPVYLPGAPRDIKLPPFLDGHVHVDQRNGYTLDGIEFLVYGITGSRSEPT